MVVHEYIYVQKIYAFPFIPHRRACLLLAICNRRLLLFHIAPLCCLRVYNVFGQCHPAPVTPATKATPHVAYTGHVPSRMPCACPRPTKKSKHSRTCCKLRTYETHCYCTRHVPRRVPHPCLCTTSVMKSRTNHFSALTDAVEATAQETNCCCTRHVPRRVPRPCLFTTGVI